MKKDPLPFPYYKCMSQIRKTSTPDPPPPKSNVFPRRPRARSEMANGTTSGSSEESDCENPRKAKFLALKNGLRAHIYQHHQMRRQLNVLDCFLPGPAHPPKSDNVAKRPPAMLETDQDFPITIKATLWRWSKETSSRIVYNVHRTFTGIKVESNGTP